MRMRLKLDDGYKIVRKTRFRDCLIVSVALVRTKMNVKDFEECHKRIEDCEREFNLYTGNYIENYLKEEGVINDNTRT